MTEREVIRRLQRLIELIQIAQGDVSANNRRFLFEVLTSDRLIVGTRRRIEAYVSTAPDICLADPPAREQRCN